MRCKKNWNIFRKLTAYRRDISGCCAQRPYRLLFTVYGIMIAGFLLFSFASCDKEELIVNRWRLQTVLMNGDTLNDSLQFNVIPKYTVYSFYYFNSLVVSTDVNNQWTSSSDGFYQFTSKSTIGMRFTLLYNRYEIEAKIKKLTRRELNLEYKDDGNTYFLKFYAY